MAMACLGGLMLLLFWIALCWAGGKAGAAVSESKDGFGGAGDSSLLQQGPVTPTSTAGEGTKDKRAPEYQDRKKGVKMGRKQPRNRGQTL